MRDTTYVVAPIVIEAPRPDARAQLFNRSGFVAAIDMTARAGRVDDLAAVLARVVGVRVTQYGGLGSFATVSIRGSSSSQVRTFLDGIPIDDPYLGITNLADLPLGGVERVEVYRGFSPPHLGGSAIGGAVQLVTRADGPHDAAVSGVEATSAVGSFDTERYSGSLWLRPGPVRVFAHGGYESSAGDFEFHDDNGTPHNPDDDDETATRANNDFAGWNALLRATAAAPGVVDEIALSYYDASRNNGVPGLGSYQSTTARSERRRRIGQLRLDGAPVAEQVHWWTSAFYQRSNEQFRDPDADVSLFAQDTDNTLDVYGGTARARWFVAWAPLAVEASLHGQRETYHPVQHLPDTVEGPDRWRHSTTAAFSADAFLLGQSLVLTGAMRHERHVDEGFASTPLPWTPPAPEGRMEHEETTPMIGARWQARAWLTVKGNAGRYYRLPTFLELYGNTGAVTGNDALVPERGDNLDLGVVISVPDAGRVRALFVEASVFANDIENMILFFPNSQFTVQPVNIGAARVRGVEASAGASIGTRLDLSAGYTYLDTEDTSEIPFYRGNELPSRPTHDLTASAAYRVGLVRAAYEWHHLGANWLDRANLQLAPARDLHGLVLTVRGPAGGLALTVEGRNLTDERVVDVAGYPLPGRSIYTTLRYQY